MSKAIRSIFLGISCQGWTRQTSSAEYCAELNSGRWCFKRSALRLMASMQIYSEWILCFDSRGALGADVTKTTFDGRFLSTVILFHGRLTHFRPTCVQNRRQQLDYSQNLVHRYKTRCPRRQASSRRLKSDLTGIGAPASEQRLLQFFIRIFISQALWSDQMLKYSPTAALVQI